MKMNREVCNSLKHNTAKSGFARVNFTSEVKIKFTSEKRKAVPLTTQVPKHFLFLAKIKHCKEIC